MQEFKNYLDKFGYPVKLTPNHKITIKYQKKIFLFSKFKRKFDLPLKLFSFKLIDRFYHDKFLSNCYYYNQETIRLFGKFRISINLRLLSIFSFIFINKKIIKLSKNDLFLFGPYAHSYYHALFEFLIRLIFLKKKKIDKTIWLPSTLKKYLRSKIYKRIFKDMKFIFYDESKNYIFEKCNYLTHVNGRWFLKGNKKKISRQFTYLVAQFREEVFKKSTFVKKKKYNYIIVSRAKSSKRKLLNELELLKKLKKYKFKLVFFENYSFNDQINIMRNCKVMIGYHGGGLTNIIFMKPKTAVLEILNKFYDHKLYNFISKITNVRYKKFICNKNYKNLDGEANINEIENYIKKII